MFEQYTERARRVIFFARYEASQFGSPYIEAEHILLGILREDKTLTNKFLSYERSRGHSQADRATLGHWPTYFHFRRSAIEQRRQAGACLCF